MTDIVLPKIRIEGIYSMKGRILILPLNGRGKCWLEPCTNGLVIGIGSRTPASNLFRFFSALAANMTINMRTKTRLVERDGFIFYNVTAVKIDYDLTGLKVHFDNLFEGVHTLGG